MAIKSRHELEQEGVSASERHYEEKVFLQAMDDFPALNRSQKKLFRTDDALNGSYFGDLQDEDKQALFENKLGTSVLRKLAPNKPLHMVRNEAEHALKQTGVFKPVGVARGRPLDVSNRKAFDYDGNPLTEIDEEKGTTYTSDVEKVTEAVQARTVTPDDLASPVRTHSIGDRVNKTLYFGEREDILSLEASVEFEHAGLPMGNAMQAVAFEQARYFDDTDRALRLSDAPMTREDMFRKGVANNPYGSNTEREAWQSVRDDVVKDVLRSKFTTNDKAQEALIATDGYRLAYASDNPYDGIGRSLDDIKELREEAVRKNEEFILKEQYVDTNNKMGRMTEDIRRELIEPEPEVPTHFDTQSPYREAHVSRDVDVSLSSMVPPDPDEVTYVGFSGMDPYISGDVPSTPYDVTSANRVVPKTDTPEVTPDEPKPLEMSIHAHSDLTARGQKRASLAVNRFKEEAEKAHTKGNVYVSKSASDDLKRAVWQHAKESDTLEMKPLDTSNMPDRSLIVQQRNPMSRDMVDEIAAATANSKQRDVRVLTADPVEPDAYAVNTYLVDHSDKVSVSYERDGAESIVVEPVQKGSDAKAREKEVLKNAFRRTEQMDEQAIKDSRVKAKAVKTNPDKGVYAEDPFQ